jgi:hypothetical protein
VNHRFSHSFSAIGNYTWSHCLNQGEANQDISNMYQNPASRRAEWGNCASDRRSVINLSLVARTPKFASSWTQKLAGNWQFSGIYAFSSGSWNNVTDGTDISLTGVGLDRPNVTGDVHVAEPSIRQWFNTSAFTRQNAGTFGNASRNSILGPSRWNIDTAVWRTFPIWESFKLDVRWEAFNVLNHARFNNPNTSLNAGTFGQITTAQDPRIMQVAMKITF